MATLTDVARAAGVSLTTASMVLNKGKQENRVSAACAERVRSVAKKLGYIPNYHARSMKLGRAETIAVALDIGVPNEHPEVRSQLGNSYFGELVGGIELVLRNMGYQMTIVGPDMRSRAPDRGLMGIRQRRFDGCIIAGVVVRHDLTRFMDEWHDAPIVVIEYNGQTPLPVVDYDEAAGVDKAVKHLAELGHRELLWVEEVASDAPPRIASRREQLFMASVWDNGLRGQSLRLPTGNTQRNQTPDDRSMVDRVDRGVLEALRDKPRGFTAVVAFNDLTAIGVCSALWRMGVSVPGDVSVVGFDDIQACMGIPRLTSVSHRLHDMGQRACDLLMELIKDETVREQYRGKREMLTPQLVVRESTAPPRRA